MQLKGFTACRHENTVAFEKMKGFHLLCHQNAAACGTQKHLKGIAASKEFCHISAPFRVDDLTFHLKILTAA